MTPGQVSLFEELLISYNILIHLILFIDFLYFYRHGRSRHRFCECESI